MRLRINNDCAEFIATLVCQIYNNVIKSLIRPDEWKCSFLTSILEYLTFTVIYMSLKIAFFSMTCRYPFGMCLLMNTCFY